MVTATVETTMAEGLTQALDRIFANVEELSAREIYHALVACDYLQSLFNSARTSIESGLRQGVPARAFASQYEQSVKRVDGIRERVAKMLVQARKSRISELREELISKYEGLEANLQNLRRFIMEAITAAQRPTRPIDWQHVREAEEAYERGETKPIRKIARTTNGS